MSEDFLRFAVPSIAQEEIDEVVACLKSGWWTTGPRCRQFERDFAEFIGVSHALAVNSATAGLHLALEAIGIRPGDKVLTTPYTFTATAEVVTYLGADPVFTDIEQSTMNIDADLVSASLASNPDIKAVMPVHFAGQSCDMDALVEACRKHGALIVEDAAHALPTTYKGRTIGTIGDLTVFSFYATKTIATGEGGMIVTANDEYAERIRTMRLHGISRDVFDRYSSKVPSWYYEVIAPGFKYNLTDIAAALGIHQLRKAREFATRRARIASAYTEAFGGLPLRVPAVRDPADEHSWHLYVIHLELDQLMIGRDRFIELMAERGVGTSVHFIPLHIQPYWRDRYGYRPSDFPHALAAYERSVSLPIYPAMTDSDVERVIESVTSIVRMNRR